MTGVQTCALPIFSLHVGLATNNLAELAAIRRGLEMAWDKGIKHLQLELDSKVVLTWLTNPYVNYPTNMMPLICDCRNLLILEWEVHMRHVYREANGCADALAKRGTCQRTVETIYEHYPTFVDVSYIRDLAALGETRLCTPGVVTNVL